MITLKIEVLGQRPQQYQVTQNSYVQEVINMIIQKCKLKEQESQLMFQINGMEIKKNTRINNKIQLQNEVISIKKIEQQTRQVQGIKLCYNKETGFAYVYPDDLINVLYDQVEKQFKLPKGQFKLTFNDKILEKQNSLQQYNINANSKIEVTLLNQNKLLKQMINLVLQYQKDQQPVQFDFDGKIFELEEKAKSLFRINQDICIFNNNQLLQKESKLSDVELNKNQLLLILLKDSYQSLLSYINIIIDLNGIQFKMEVATDTQICEIIQLLKNQHNLNNIDLAFNSQVLPLNQTFNELKIQQNTILYVVAKVKSMLILNLNVGSKIEKIEIDKETTVLEFYESVQSNYQLQNIEITLENGQKLNKNQSFQQQNIQNGSLLIVQSLNFYQNKPQNQYQQQFSQQQQPKQQYQQPQLQQYSQPQQQYQQSIQKYQLQQPQIVDGFIINIEVILERNQQAIQFQMSSNSLIRDLENQIRNLQQCSNKIQLVYQKRILESFKTFAQEQIPNGCQLQCLFLIDNVQQKIKIISTPQSDDNRFIKFIILFQHQKKDMFIKGCNLVEELIQSAKQAFQINQEVYLSNQGKILNPKLTLNQNEIKDNAEISVHFRSLMLFIKYKDQKTSLEVDLDTLVEQLKLQIKQYYQIENDFDLFIDGMKINPTLQIKDLQLQNQQCLEIQENQKQKPKIREINKEQQQMIQLPNNQNIQQNYSKQQLQYQQQQSKNAGIIITQIEDLQSNQNIKKPQPIIQIQSKIQGNHFHSTMQLQWESTISEIIEYIEYQEKLQKNSIKLTYQGITLKKQQSLEEIQIKDKDILFVEQNTIS